MAPAQEDVDEADTDPSVESDSETPTTRPTPKVAPHLRDVFTYPIDEEPPAPWRPASEEDGQDEAESADALESVDTAEQGEDRERDDVAEDRERDDVAEEGVDAPADEWAPVDEARAQDEHEATEPDAGDDHIETDERVDGDAVAEDGNEYAPESVEADRAEDADDAENAEADAQDADERDADAHAEDVPESDLPESAEAAATQHSENEDTGELPDHEEPRAEESAESDEDRAADNHADDQAAEHVGDQPADHAETETEPDEEGDDVPEHADEQENAESDAPRWEPPAHMSRRATRRAREESSELNDGGATEAGSSECDLLPVPAFDQTAGNGISSGRLQLHCGILPVGMCVSGNRDVYVVSDREPDHCIYQYVWNFAFVVFVGRNLVFSARLGVQRNDRNPFDPDTDRCLYLSYDEKLDACGRN